MRTMVWSLLLLAWARPADAQAALETEDTASEGSTDGVAEEAADEGRLHFERAMAAAQEARWADALPLFERSYAISGEAAALYNVATTLRALGRHVDSAAAFERLLAEHPTLDAARRADISEQRDREVARTATLSLLDDPGRTGSLRLRLDARRLELSLPATVRLDEGVHVLDARAEGHRDFHWEGELRAGDEIEVRLSLPALPPVDVTRPLRRSPALWIVVGTVVLGAVATALVLTLRADPLRPREGTQVVRL